jgi:DmsE family decaheme c-type cytochrome
MKLLKKLLIACALVAGAVAGVSAQPAPPASLSGSAAVQPLPAGTAAVDRTLKGDAVCTRCHDESESKAILAMYKTRHGNKADARTPGCQSCHGGSAAHLQNKSTPPDVVFGKTKGASTAEVQSGVCLTCHQAGKRAFWQGSQHQGQDLSCSTRHTNHDIGGDKVLGKVSQPEVCFTCHKTERAQTHRISTHPIDAGKMACSDCHNPHGSTGPKLLVKNNVNETCYTCHAEKRGPFLWEHAPVVDDCTNCHTPHGSSNTPLLKVRMPFLCQECHSGDHGKNIYSGANLPKGNVTTVNGLLPGANQSPPAQLNGRACTNCHSLVHGSNHPAGAKFQR